MIKVLANLYKDYMPGSGSLPLPFPHSQMYTVYVCPPPAFPSCKALLVGVPPIHQLTLKKKIFIANVTLFT